MWLQQRNLETWSEWIPTTALAEGRTIIYDDNMKDKRRGRTEQSTRGAGLFQIFYEARSPFIWRPLKQAVLEWLHKLASRTWLFSPPFTPLSCCVKVTLSSLNLFSREKSPLFGCMCNRSPAALNIQYIREVVPEQWCWDWVCSRFSEEEEKTPACGDPLDLSVNFQNTRLYWTY